jgi:AcrR family transcriptional regulator
MTISPPATRRARHRQETLAEIKALARAQLAAGGAGAVNLRAIAREMGTTSSALFRYFPSYNDLISALLADAYAALADALAAAVGACLPADHAGRWAALCHAYRDWSLASPAEFALTHGTPVPGYQAPAEVTGPAAARTITTALGVYAAAVTAGAADPARSAVPAGLQTGPLWQALLAGQSQAYQPRLAGIILTAWASVIGYLSAEIFGSLTSLVADTGTLYRAHVRAVMAGMGYDPGLAEAATQPSGRAQPPHRHLWPLPRGRTPKVRGPRDPAARNAVPKNNSVQERSASSSCMAARIASHGRRMIHSSMEAKCRTIAVPSCASHPGVLSGTLRSSTTQRPPPERAAAPWAMTSAHSGTCDRAYVDRIASTSAGKSKSATSACTRLILLQPFFSIRSWAWASIASVRSTPTIRPSGPITSSISGKFRPVPHAMSITLSPARRPSACTARRRCARWG